MIRSRLPIRKPSIDMARASGLLEAMAAKARSNSPSLVTFKTSSFRPSVAAAVCASRVWLRAMGLEWLARSATDRTPGSISRSRSSRFPSRMEAESITTVMLPPGRLRLSTSPSSTGSKPIVKTVGIVDVAALTARGTGVPPTAMMMLGLALTRSTAEHRRTPGPLQAPGRRPRSLPGGQHHSLDCANRMRARCAKRRVFAEAV